MGSARILVVDDRSPVREVLREQLSDLGYGVIEASDGVEALSSLKRGPVDLVVSDLRMPGMDGLELLKELRKDGVATLLFSAHGDVPVAVEAMREGAVDFVTLPIEPQELARRISSHIGRGTQKPSPESPLGGARRIAGHHGSVP